MRFSLLFVSLLFLLETSAQDPRFSQVYAAHTHLNPALSGVFEGQYRAQINYRDQWGSILASNAFRTFGVAFDYRYNIASRDYISIGFNALRDQAGTSNYTQQFLNVHGSYLKQLSGNRYSGSSQYLVAAAQIGMGQFSLEAGNLWFSSQYDNVNTAVNTSIDSGERINDQTDMFTQFNAGLLWYAVFDENMSLYAGASLSHINEPQVSFLDDNSVTLTRRMALHIGGELGVTDELSLLPVMVFMAQDPSMEIDFGAQMRYSNHDWNELAIRAGLFGRVVNSLENYHSDAIVLVTGLEIERWQLGLSYDINVSTLERATNYRGAFEISLKYTHRERRIIRVNCPKL